MGIDKLGEIAATSFMNMGTGNIANKLKIDEINQKEKHQIINVKLILWATIVAAVFAIVSGYSGAMFAKLIKDIPLKEAILVYSVLMIFSMVILFTATKIIFNIDNLRQ